MSWTFLKDYLKIGGALLIVVACTLATATWMTGCSFLKEVLSLAGLWITAFATCAAAVATWNIYLVAKNALPDHKAEVEDLRDAKFKIIAPDHCVDVNGAKQFPDFPDIHTCPKGQSSHYFVKSNDVLLGRKYSKAKGQPKPADWCYLGVYLSSQKEVDAYSEIVLRIVVNQDEKTSVFYGHKDQLRFEPRSEANYGAPPYSQDYRIPKIKPKEGEKCLFLGVIKISIDATLSDHWDGFFEWTIIYRVGRSEIPIAEDSISIQDKLQEFQSRTQ